MYSGLINLKDAKVESLETVMSLATFDIAAGGTVSLTGTTGSIAVESKRTYYIRKIKVIPLYFDQANLATAARYRYLANEQFAFGATLDATCGQQTLFTRKYITFSNNSIDNIILFEPFAFNTDASLETTIQLLFSATGTQYNRFENLSYGNTGGQPVSLVGHIVFEGVSVEFGATEKL